MVSTQNQATLRRVLFEQTHEQHQLAETRFDELDIFANPESYRQWLQAMLWLHKRYQNTITTAATTVNLAPVGAELTTALNDDVVKMSDPLQYPPARPSPLAVHTTERLDEKLGALYVFEGSGVGARILYKRALKHQRQPLQYLGRAQALSQNRWPAVVKVIDELGERSDISYQHCANAAKQVFTDLAMGLNVAADGTSASVGAVV